MQCVIGEWSKPEQLIFLTHFDALLKQGSLQHDVAAAALPVLGFGSLDDDDSLFPHLASTLLRLFDILEIYRYNDMENVQLHATDDTLQEIFSYLERILDQDRFAALIKHVVSSTEYKSMFHLNNEDIRWPTDIEGPGRSIERAKKLIAYFQPTCTSKVQITLTIQN